MKKELTKGTRVVFRNKFGKLQKGTFIGVDTYPSTVGDVGLFECRPFGDDMDVNCLYPLDSEIIILTEEEFQNRPWVE